MRYRLAFGIGREGRKMLPPEFDFGK